MKEKILIALGDMNLQNMIAEKLKQGGYVIETLQNGNEVMDRLKMFKPDLLLIDISLPNRSGYDILNEKSFDREVTKIPVIIVSNSGSPVQMKQIPSTPVIKDYVIKSHIEPDEIIEKVQKVFGKNTEVAKDTMVKNNKKILWVEDDKLLSTILSKKIETSGYTLLKANGDEEAFKYLESEMPDIIVLDIMLPEMNGFDILQKIKMNEKHKKIPVIMLSNLSKQADIEKAKMLGANKFIVKAAVSLDEIIHEIATLTK
ncbi:MAG TPA: response regulator [Candidatus Paceibacterota bacterium]